MYQISAILAKESHAKTLSPGKNSPSHRHQESYEHTQRADKAMGNVTKKRAIRRATTGDIARLFSKGHGPRAMDSLMDSSPSYLPNSIMRRLVGFTQGGIKFGPCAKPVTLASAELCFAAKSLGRNDQGETSFIEAEAGKDILKRGLQSMSDDAIQKATLAKQALREIRCLHVMLTVWEIEEAEHHAELLRELQRSNVEGYLDAAYEATWFERTVYPNDLASLATADEQLNQLESHTEERELILSKEELAKELKA
ncbi:hypothetical protein DFH29DRAFT_884334 [Suillus ampliporus]|nr:hypothetical protein DFH29DRAFT_884334 [Suillus ampliporus]